MELTNEELQAKITEAVLLLEKWTVLWAKVADENAILDFTSVDSLYWENGNSPAKKSDFIRCSTESIDYIRSLES